MLVRNNCGGKTKWVSGINTAKEKSHDILSEGGIQSEICHADHLLHTAVENMDDGWILPDLGLPQTELLADEAIAGSRMEPQKIEAVVPIGVAIEKFKLHTD